MPGDDALIVRTEAYVRAEMGDEPTGHDWWHASRVRDTALRIARVEGADLVVVELAALLHDLEDEKFSGSAEAGPRAARAFLLDAGAAPDLAEAVAEIIAGVSFMGAGVADRPLSLAGACVRDADRIDALGAIGIARTFAYGGRAGRLIHDPADVPQPAATPAAYRARKGPSIAHFHEKLLLLRDRMTTAEGRRIADERHAYMEGFLARFDAEWHGRA